MRANTSMHTETLTVNHVKERTYIARLNSILFFFQPSPLLLKQRPNLTATSSNMPPKRKLSDLNPGASGVDATAIDTKPKIRKTQALAPK